VTTPLDKLLNAVCDLRDTGELSPEASIVIIESIIYALEEEVCSFCSETECECDEEDEEEE
jgi:hypothetical protein